MNKIDKSHTIAALDHLGTFLKDLGEEEFTHLAAKVVNNNPWFTPGQTKVALEGLGRFLEAKALEAWLGDYDISKPPLPKRVGLVMAGNVPAVGFHDLMCVLLAGHKAHIKLSSTDQVIIPWLVEELVGFYPLLQDQIVFAEQLKGLDAYIATGSDNTARYFEYYFGKYPHIIRKNRTSVGILTGDEDTNALKALGRDIFQYFGLGCRNVSKLYINDPGQLVTLLDALEENKAVADHHKFINNYDYNKSIYLVNKEPHLDNGFLLVKESKALVSPIAVLYYETYDDTVGLRASLAGVGDKIQCIVSDGGWYPESLPLGQAQFPRIQDYADHVDTLAFLLKL
ncbi:aldehyde dehydrogenase family protein [Pleomorphovibrio marinus]|uniref:acyl-CoA reductase n=1 Tax=Pleomorphovibrio marinus TaxID=2164132 RepID=UPI000E0BB50F|nr:acyl-CoA reductase [Pleomorphovibrio marinus]